MTGAVQGVYEIDASEARRLTDRIKVALDGTWQLVQEAYLTRAWSALGYASWDDYCTREFGTSRLRLPREERQEVVSSLREIGMSVRAIAAATGNDKNTVMKSLRQVSETHTPTPEQESQDEPAASQSAQAATAAARDRMLNVDDLNETEDEDDFNEPEDVPVATPPARVTGTDGKSYAATPKRNPTPAPAPSPRPPLPPQFATLAHDLTKTLAKIERLQMDERFQRNRQAIADTCLPEIRRAHSVLDQLVQELTPTSTTKETR